MLTVIIEHYVGVLAPKNAQTYSFGNAALQLLTSHSIRCILHIWFSRCLAKYSERYPVTEAEESHDHVWPHIQKQVYVYVAM